MAIRNISDLKVRGGAVLRLGQHGHHVFLLFGKAVLFAINKAWIKLSFGGDTSFNVLFVVEYQFSVGTAFSLDTGKFCHTRTCRLSCLSLPLCNIFGKLQIMIKALLNLFHLHYNQFHDEL